MTYLQVFGYEQLAKPFCAEPQEPHTLPKSYLSENYPCNGTWAKKALYLGTQPGRVYWDYLHLRHPDCWVTASAVGLLLRTLLALVHPESARYAGLTVASRLVAPLTLLAWVLTYRQEPSTLATWFIRSWPMLDCAFVMVFPTSARLEAVYAIISFVVSLLLGLRTQSSRRQLIYSLVTCVVSSAWIQYVHVCWQKKPPAAADGAPAGRRGPRAAVASAAAAAVATAGNGSSDPTEAVRRRRRGGAVGFGSGSSGTGAAVVSGAGASAEEAGANPAAAAAAAAAGPAAMAGSSNAPAAGVAVAAAAAGAAAGARLGGADGLAAISSMAEPCDRTPPINPKDVSPGAVSIPGPVADANLGPGARPAQVEVEVGAAAADGGAATLHLPRISTPTSPPSPSSPSSPPTPRAAAAAAAATAGTVRAAAAAAAGGVWSSYSATGGARRRHYRRPPSNDLASERDDAGGHGRFPAASAALPAAPCASYVPVVRLVRLQLKIDGAHPDQVAPGYEERIARVVAAAGYELDSVYMRRGCIELVVNARSWQNPLAPGAAQEVVITEAAPPTAAMVTAAAAAGEPGVGSGGRSPAGGGAAAHARGGGSPAVAGGRQHHHRLLRGSAGSGGGSGGSAVLKSVVVIDVRAAAAAAAAAARGSAAPATAAESDWSGDTQLARLETSRSKALLTAPTAATAAAAEPADAAPAHSDPSGDIDIGAIIRALGLGRSTLPHRDDDAADGASDDAADGLDRWEVWASECGGGGGTAAATGVEQSRSAPDPWTHPALLLQPSVAALPPPAAAAAAPASAPSFATPAGVAAATAATAVATWQEGLAQVQGRCAPAPAAAAAAVAAPCWCVSVYPRVFCPAAHAGGGDGSGSGGGVAAAAPEGMVYGPFRLEITVLWPPICPPEACGGGGAAATAALGAAAPRGPPPSLDQLHLLLRSRGRHLPAQVLQIAPAPAHEAMAAAPSPLDGPSTALQYSLEVPYLPSRAGLLLLDVLGVAAVPVVLMYDEQAALELQAVVDSWASTSEELDDLLYDISTFVHGVADAEELAAAAAAAAAAAIDGAGGCRGTSLRLNSRFISLGCHLLSFAVSNGWTALSALLQRALTASMPAAATAARGCGSGGGGGGECAVCPTPPAAAGAATCKDCSDSGCAAAGGGGGGIGGGRVAATDAPPQSGTTAAAAATAGAQQQQQQQQRRRRSVAVAAAVATRVLSSLWEVLAARGFDTQEFRSYRASWRAAGAHLIQWLDALMMAVVLWVLLPEWRPHGPAAAPAASPPSSSASSLLGGAGASVAFSVAINLLGTASGLASAGAWLVLPRERWMRVAERCLMLRQVTNCLVKLLVGCSHCRPLPCFRKFELGWGVWLMEGVLLPGASLLSPAPALLMAAARAPLLSCSWLALAGGAEEPGAAPARSRQAVMRGCGIAGLSAATSLVCYWCLCHSYRRRQHHRRAHHHVKLE